MKIAEKNINEIYEYENNPRNNDNAVEAVANSIKAFGYLVPIVIDKNGVIVCGHTRKKAAEKLGLKKIQCVLADDLTEEQIKAFRLADNKTAELAGWDFEKMGIELEEIEEIDMSEFGFESHDLGCEIDDFFDKAPEQKKESDTKKTIKCPHCGEIIEI